MPRPTTTARRELGEELRRLRGDRKGAVVARALGWSESKLSRIETARTGIRDSDLERLLALIEAPADDRRRLRELARRGRARVWWTPYRSSLTEPYDEYVALEAEATLLCEWEAQVVPGLLQTDEYARVVIEAGADRAEDDVIETRVMLRMNRQTVLSREDPPRLRMVLDEAVLHRNVGGRAVMRRQMQRLYDACLRPGIELQVLPFSAGVHGALAGSFLIVEFGDERPAIVHSEGLTGGVFRTREAELSIYRKVFADLRDRSLSLETSRELIARVGEALD
jgi:transcriptional regulator with XRE-family HTH domain